MSQRGEDHICDLRVIAVINTYMTLSATGSKKAPNTVASLSCRRESEHDD